MFGQFYPSDWLQQLYDAPPQRFRDSPPLIPLEGDPQGGQRAGWNGPYGRGEAFGDMFGYGNMDPGSTQDLTGPSQSPSMPLSGEVMGYPNDLESIRGFDNRGPGFVDVDPGGSRPGAPDVDPGATGPGVSGPGDMSGFGGDRGVSERQRVNTRVNLDTMHELAMAYLKRGRHPGMEGSGYAGYAAPGG